MWAFTYRFIGLFNVYLKKGSGKKLLCISSLTCAMFMVFPPQYRTSIALNLLVITKQNEYLELDLTPMIVLCTSHRMLHDCEVVINTFVQATLVSCARLKLAPPADKTKASVDAEQFVFIEEYTHAVQSVAH